MNMKSIVSIFLFSFFLLPFCSVQAVVTPPPAMQNMPEFQMSPEEAKAIAEFIESLSPEELNELAEFGKSIVEEAEKAGIDPFVYAQQLDAMYAQEQKEFFDKMAGEEKKPTEPKKAEPPVDTKKLSSLQETIQDIINSLQDIRQKASHNEEFSNQLIPFKYRLDDIIYYLHALLHEKILAHLSKPEFDNLVTQLRSFQATMNTLAKRLEVSEFSLEGYDPYHVLNISRTATPAQIVQSFQKEISSFDQNLIARYQSDSFIPQEKDEKHQQFKEITNAYTHLQRYEEARHVFDEIIRSLMNVTPQLLEDIKNVFKKYEPDVVKSQQEREKIEQEARQRQEDALRKMPLPGRYLSEFTMPRTPYYGSSQPSYDYGTLPSYYNPSSYSSYPSFSSPSLERPTGRIGEKGTTGKGTKKDEKKKKDKKDTKGKTKEDKTDKGDKKGSTSDKKVDEVEQYISLAKFKFDQLKGLLKKEEHANLLKDSLVYFTKPLAPGDQRPADIKKLTELLRIINDITAIFVELDTIITNASKKFKDNEDKQKQLKESIQEEFKKIESNPPAPEFALVVPLIKFKGNTKVNVEGTLKPFDSEKLFALTGIEALLKGMPAASRKDALALNPAKDAVEIPDPSPDEPHKKKTVLQSRNYIQKLQDAYKAAKDAVDALGKKKPKPLLPATP